MCIFCKIIDKEIPSTIVYEDDHVLAILDVAPSTKGHTLVFPKKHYESILDCPPEEFANLMIEVQKITKIVMEENNAKGINLLNNTNAVAGQSIPHIHFHIIPRYKEGELTIEL